MLKSSNWMQREIALVEVKTKSKTQKKSPKELCSALQPPALLFFRNYMNDSLRTDVFVRFQPESIACACIYLAARTLEVSHTFMDLGVFSSPFNRRRKSELCVSLSLSDPSSKSPTLVFTVWSNRGRNSRNLLKNLAALHKEKGLVLFHVGSPQWKSWKIWACLKPQLQAWKWTKSTQRLELFGFSFLSLGVGNQEIQLSQAVLLCSQVDLSDLESKIEKKKLAIEEAKAQAKGLVPEGVPSLDNTSGFSPIPKNGK